jgi:hypothetical protein
MLVEGLFEKTIHINQSSCCPAVVGVDHVHEYSLAVSRCPAAFLFKAAILGFAFLGFWISLVPSKHRVTLHLFFPIWLLKRGFFQGTSSYRSGRFGSATLSAPVPAPVPAAVPAVAPGPKK